MWEARLVCMLAQQSDGYTKGRLQYRQWECPKTASGVLFWTTNGLCFGKNPVFAHELAR
jgi:hypothetical protein